MVQVLQVQFNERWNMGVKIMMSSLPYEGKKGNYAACSVVEVDSDEALELVKSNLATFVGDSLSIQTTLANDKHMQEVAALIASRFEISPQE